MRPTADLLVVNGSVWSGGARLAGVDAIAVAGGHVLAVGRRAELASLATPDTRVIDAGGGTITPGLADAHIHMIQWARALDEIDLRGAETRAECLARVGRFLAQTDAEVIVGRGWDASGWSDPPDRGSLDRVTGDRPVLLYSQDFHNLWVNSAALRAAGVGPASQDPKGGRIERDPKGEPTGLLREHAVRLCAALVRESPEADLERARAAGEKLLAHGITAVHDFEGAEASRVLRALTTKGPGRIRVLMHIPASGLESALALGLESGVGDDWFRLGAIKLFADGTLGSRTAAMLEPYEGSTDHGFELLTHRELAELVARSLAGSLSVSVHAIGDRACRSTLDAFQASASSIPRLRLPPRLEHVQLIDPVDLPRLGRLGVAASMQPTHCTSDIELAERHWGRRVAHAYPWRGILESGARLAFGSDAPVEPPIPALGLQAAVTRERPDRPGPFVPEQCITLDAALTAYTEGPARLSGSWPRLGNLSPGAVADLVVWDRDLHRSDARRLGQASPVTTILDGEVVYSQDAGTDTAEHAPAPGARVLARQGRP